MNTKGIATLFAAIAVLAATFFLIPMGYREISYVITGDIRDINRISNRADLSRLFDGVNFSDIEIVDIQIVGNNVHVFCEGTDDAMPVHFMEYDDMLSLYHRLEARSTGDTMVRHGYSDGLFRARNVGTVREIHWIQFAKSCDDKGNILLVTSLPSNGVRVNVRTIMNEEK